MNLTRLIIKLLYRHVLKLEKMVPFYPINNLPFNLVVNAIIISRYFNKSYLYLSV